ncbi:beta-N-acetylhexosaminidase [Nocardia sp. NBC_01503]|uniref:beta-N-acetylhexosaminidase n=1 Tax=Nocardia sp. NBC_01503 TaxID=2975997 RepID=UPI002E7B3754|nr:beta-N-acetylhexosaminidase [Nocardia sp. NBC_01503]WTL35502.1 beta-N-acetylhexosaminidase [Nocardia sp. NBC_01503]
MVVRSRFTRHISRCLTAVACTLAATPIAFAEPVAAQPLPSTVPSIKEWRSGGTGFTLGSDARIVADAALRGPAQRLSEDLARLGRAVPVVGASAREGDIVLRETADAPEAAESYRISSAEQLTLSARDLTGIAHGTQTLLQWLRQRTAIPGGTAQDWPDYTERGLMLDTGREFFPVDWVKNRIRDAAYLRMNMVQLHLSDSQGFRLASRIHPEITSAEHYSAADIAEILDYADSYGIEIVPEIDMPSHMNAILAEHQDLVLRPAHTSAQDAERDNLIAGGIGGKIDLSNPAAYQFISEILHEFVPMFRGRYWHLGCDEYISDYSRYPQLSEYATRVLGPDAAAGDVIVAFANWAADIVESLGKTPRAWNDGFDQAATLAPKTEVVMQYWSASAGGLPWLPGGRTPAEITAAGHPILNAAFTPAYFVTGGPAAALNAPPELLYAWDPGLFVNGSRLPESDRRLLRGSMLFLWCDDPNAMSPEQIAGPLRTRLSVMAQQLWSGTGGIAYPEFIARNNAVGWP